MAGNVPEPLGRRYIDKYKYTSGSIYTDCIVESAQARPDQVEEFIKLLSISPSYNVLLKMCEDDKVFFRACPDLAELVPDVIKTDLFYTALLGKHYDGIPSQLVFILEKARKMYEYPNLALSMIPDSLWVNYTWLGCLKGFTIFDVICNVWKSDIKILSPYRRRALYGGCVELYIENDSAGKFINRIAIIPEDINSCISDSEVSKVVYNEKLGLCVGDKPLRQMAGHVGLTRHDFDLRGVI